jgi:carbon storage regulator
MLIVHRRAGQRIAIGEGIEITIIEHGRGGTRLGIVAPKGVTVLRGEIRDAIVAANRAAVQVEKSAQVDTDSEEEREPCAS